MTGRIVAAPALALAQRPHRESDRIVTLYCRDQGKAAVRFPGVRRAAGKLKALSEPMVWGEYRLHIRPGAEFAVAAGGGLESTFPGLRASLEWTLRGLEVCELLGALTPPWQPNPEKYELAVGCLLSLERAALAGQDAPWLLPAFTLRLLESAGFGMAGLRVREESRSLWEALHSLELDALRSLPADAERLPRLEAFLDRTLRQVLERPPRCATMRRSLASAK
ncbi:MAG TPA: DNA repair protein RecO [Elusimicrobiota bacterium]|nr:DNA repair protein RecO [Elusimicrobiota bacterium]